jgi:hypothetical protein
LIALALEALKLDLLAPAAVDGLLHAPDEGVPMPVEVLPHYLAPGLRAVFVGTAVRTTSAVRGHYCSGPGNMWEFLRAGGLTDDGLGPDDDWRIVGLGFGLTDLVKSKAATWDAGLTGFDVLCTWRSRHPTAVATAGPDPPRPAPARG